METQLTLFGLSRSAGEPVPEKKKGRGRVETFEDYEGFVEKFAAKKTTDDCYTPEPVYRAVVDFVGTMTDLEGRDIVRPFWPGADFTARDYPAGCIVIDNPPFSILTKIVRFYCAAGVQFFLFAPSLTLFVAKDCDLTYIIADCDITFENGAVVRTGFVTNIPSDTRIWCCPQLKKAIEAAQAFPDKTKKGFLYPDHIVTAATLQRLVAHATELRIRKDACYPIRDSDMARAAGRSLFGGGVPPERRRSGGTRSGGTRSGGTRSGGTRSGHGPLPVRAGAAHRRHVEQETLS